MEKRLGGRAAPYNPAFTGPSGTKTAGKPLPPPAEVDGWLKGVAEAIHLDPKFLAMEKSLEENGLDELDMLTMTCFLEEGGATGLELDARKNVMKMTLATVKAEAEKASARARKKSLA